MLEYQAESLEAMPLLPGVGRKRGWQPLWDPNIDEIPTGDEQPNPGEGDRIDIDRIPPPPRAPQPQPEIHASSGWAF